MTNIRISSPFFPSIGGEIQGRRGGFLAFKRRAGGFVQLSMEYGTSSFWGEMGGYRDFLLQQHLEATA